MNKYLSIIDSLLDTHGPVKKRNKKEVQFLTKPWITQCCKTLLKRKTTSTQNL